jgi:deazaflavin-dependent oxidoreductase (nitroreductase family)
VSSTGPADHNKAIIDEFRSNDGVVGGYFAGVPLVLVHHKGAKSGTNRVVPLASQKQDNGWAVFASKGGADDNPAWYYNLLANPRTTIEVGTETVPVRAYEAKDDQYDRIWTRQKTELPTFAEYEKKTKREYIPVIMLERR